MFATYAFVYLQNINLYVEQIIYIFARYNRSIYTIFLYLQYIDFVFAIHTLNKIEILGPINVFWCLQNDNIW